MVTERTIKPAGIMTGVLISKPWRPDPAILREEIWFDDFNGFLYIDFRKTCGICLRTSTWQRGFRMWRWNYIMQAWEPEDWDPGIPLPLPAPESRIPSDEFFYEMPADVIRIIRPFKWRQCMLLKMMRQCPEILELIQSNPVLAWLLADSIAEKKIPLSEGCSWVFRKRREILAFIGIPASESTVRTLSKIRCKHYSQSLFMDLMSIIRDEKCLSRLRFIEKLDDNDIQNLKRQFECTYWMLSVRDRTGESPDEFQTNNIYQLWTDMEGLGQLLAIADRKKRMASCGSTEALYLLHDKWSRVLDKERSEQMIATFRAAHGTSRFPSPPLPGCVEIMPVTTIEDLVREGDQMHNCVASYAERIFRGECCIYRVLAPERATLQVAMDEGTLLLRQLKAACNKDPAESTKRFVDGWFQAAMKENPHVFHS